MNIHSDFFLIYCLDVVLVPIKNKENYWLNPNSITTTHTQIHIVFLDRTSYCHPAQ